MKNKEHSSGNSSGNGWIQSLINSVLSYYDDLISNPFKNGLVYFCAGLILALIVGWLVFPVALYSEQKQPLEFNHALHMDPDIVNKLKGVDIKMGKTDAEKCLFCHSFEADGNFAGIPGIKLCKKCHDDPRSPLGETHEEELFMNEYLAKKKEVPWLVYYRQPDGVYFTHIAHVKIGELECKRCHGDHGKTMTLPIFEKNRISGYSRNIWGKNISGIKTNSWDRMKMDDCANCHTEKGHEENNDCFVCHK